MGFRKVIESSPPFQLVLKALVETLVAALSYGIVYAWVVRFLDPNVLVVGSSGAFLGRLYFLVFAYVVSGYWLFLAALVVLAAVFLPHRASASTLLLALGGFLHIACALALGERNELTLSIAISTLVGGCAVLFVYVLIIRTRLV